MRMRSASTRSSPAEPVGRAARSVASRGDRPSTTGSPHAYGISQIEGYYLSKMIAVYIYILSVHYARYLQKQRLLFVPPNPKLFVSATFIVRSWAALGA